MFMNDIVVYLWDLHKRANSVQYIMHEGGETVRLSVRTSVKSNCIAVHSITDSSCLPAGHTGRSASWHTAWETAHGSKMSEILSGATENARPGKRRTKSHGLDNE